MARAKKNVLSEIEIEGRISQCDIFSRCRRRREKKKRFTVAKLPRVTATNSDVIESVIEQQAL